LTFAFLPDADPITPGIIAACNNIIPTPRGYRSAFTGADLGYGALNSACLGAFAGRQTDGTARLFAGTATKLYEAASGAWTDRTRAVGGAYATSTARWCFAQQGNLTIAVNRYDTPQTTTSGAFANLAAMPKARFVCTAGEFVIIASTDDGTEYTDQWWTSAISDYTNWTPAASTQCVKNRQVDTPGPISGLKTLGSDAVLYKQRSMYVLSYQGPPVAWSARLISTDVGAVGHPSIVPVDYDHFFIGLNDFYRFNGTAPTPIGEGIKEFFFARVDKSAFDNIQGVYDRYRSLVYWHYPTITSGGALTEWVAYHVPTGRWGFGTLTVEATAEYLVPGTSYDSFGGAYTWDTLPTASYDSGYWGSGSAPFPIYFTTAHSPSAIAGSSSTSSITTGYFGSNDQVPTVRRVTPRFRLSPTSATLTPYYTMREGSALTTDTAVTMSLDRFDFLRSAKWQQFKMDATGDMEISGFEIDSVKGSTE
jgi:hypothetical protein